MIIMPRPKGAKNKPKETRIYEFLPDVLTTEEASHWLRISRSGLMKKVYAGEIPEDCYQKSGNRYKFIKNKLAILLGIRPKADNFPELLKQDSCAMEKNIVCPVIEEGINLLGLYLSKFKFTTKNNDGER
jgi:hypothetical protein